MTISSPSRRQVLTAAWGLAVGTVVAGAMSTPSRADATVGGVDVIPELAPQWKKLDLAEILSRPAAYAVDQPGQEPSTNLGCPGCRAAP